MKSALDYNAKKLTLMIQSSYGDVNVGGSNIILVGGRATDAGTVVNDCGKEILLVVVVELIL